jgi:hypothetical protein
MEFLETADVARDLGISGRTARQLVGQGNLRAVAPTRRGVPFFHAKDAERPWLECASGRVARSA